MDAERVRARRRARWLALILPAAVLVLWTTPAVSAWARVVRARTAARLIGGRYVSAEGAILQKGAVDCGVAAMKMLVASYGYAPSRLDALDDSIVARRRGMSMLEIQRALAGLGVVTEGRQMNLAALAHVRLPVIAHAPDHFIVIDEMRPDGLWDIRDPAIGRVRMDASALARRWDGKVLVVTGRRAAAR